MSAPFWTNNLLATAWDQLWLGTNTVPIVFPGLARIHVATEVHYKRNKSQGTDAPAITDKGMQAKKVLVELKIWTPQQWDNWQMVYSLLNFDSSGKPRPAYQLIHPQAEANGLGEVVIESVDVPPPNAKDPMIIRIKMVEVAKPVPNNPAPPQKSFSQVGLTPLPGSNGSP